MAEFNKKKVLFSVHAHGVIPSGNQDIETLNEYDVSEKATARISATERVKIIPENIKKDVTLLGVTGTHQGGITPTGKINITDTTEVDVTNYAAAQVVDANLVAGNIKKDVTILGITGTHEGGGTGGYSITTNVVAGTASGSTATYGSPNTAQVTITPNSGASLPQSITVSGAQYTYNSTTGVIDLTNATGNITINVVCVAQFNITANVTNGTASGASTISSDSTATVTIAASSGYANPVSITVANADYTYNKSTGAIVLSNPTADVVITVVCVVLYSITKTITNGTASGATSIAADDTAVVNLAPNPFYVMPESVSVSNASYVYDKNSKTITLTNPVGNVTISATCEEAGEIEDTWEEILTNIDNGTYSGKYSAGQYKKIDLGTEGQIRMLVTRIDYDDKSDGTGKAPITWTALDLLNSSCARGSSVNEWSSTSLKSWLEGTIKPLIPTAIRERLVSVNKTYRKSGGNDVYACDIWCPSYSDFQSGYTNVYSSTELRKKTKVGGSFISYWTGDYCGAKNSYTYGFIVTASGELYGGNMLSDPNRGDKSNGVCIGFCT